MPIFPFKPHLKFIRDHNVCRNCFALISRNLCSLPEKITETQGKTPSLSPQKPNYKPQTSKRTPDFRILLPSTWKEYYLQNWNENLAVRKTFRKNKLMNRIESMDDFFRELYIIGGFPRNWTELQHWLKTRSEKKNLLQQTFIPERIHVLKPDLAAAHFIIFRRGRVKFKNQEKWVNLEHAKKLLPFKYIPGYEVEAIDAEGTHLRREGLDNIADIPSLKWLSLKGLIEIDDWCLDWISNQFEGLEYLDISGCRNVTHRGLSCICRFESLKSLIVEGVSDTPEFKVACLMLQDILPELEIGGIDLRIPEKIDPIKTETPTQNMENGDVT